jgi:hypothetical protein
MLIALILASCATIALIVVSAVKGQPEVDRSKEEWDYSAR